MYPKRLIVLVAYAIFALLVVFLTVLAIFYPPPPLSNEVMEKMSFYGLDPIWAIVFVGWLGVLALGMLFFVPHTDLHVGQSSAKVRKGELVVTFFECPLCHVWFVNGGYCSFCQSAPELKRRTETLRKK